MSNEIAEFPAIPDVDNEETVTLAIFRGDCRIEYVQDNGDSPEIAVQARVEAMVWLCYKSPLQTNGKSIMSWPSEGIGLFVVIEKDNRDRVDT